MIYRFVVRALAFALRHGADHDDLRGALDRAFRRKSEEWHANVMMDAYLRNLDRKKLSA